MLLTDNNSSRKGGSNVSDREQRLSLRKVAMRLPTYPPVLAIVVLAAPACAVAASGTGVQYQAGLAAVIVWLAALGWGFQAMLHHRLTAEDRLARLEAAVACERDAHAVQLRCTRQRILQLEAEWLRLDECLREGDLLHVAEHMRAVQAAIAVLQQSV